MTSPRWPRPKDFGDVGEREAKCQAVQEGHRDFFWGYEPWLLVIAGYFFWMIHSTNEVFLVLMTEYS